MTIFDEIMEKSSAILNESAKRTTTVVKNPSIKKLNYKKFKVESLRFLKEEDEVSEDDFDIPEDINDESTEDEVVLVIDPEVKDDEEVPEDAAKEMIGDYVYKCPICGANYVCDCESDSKNESVEVDENGVPIECPICGDDAEQILIGEISAPSDLGDNAEPTEMEPEESPEENKDSEDEEDVDDEDIEAEYDESEDKEEEENEDAEKEESLTTRTPMVRSYQNIFVRESANRNRRNRRLSESKKNRRVVKESYKVFEIGDTLDDGEDGLWEVLDTRINGNVYSDEYLLKPLSGEAEEAMDATLEIEPEIEEERGGIWITLDGFDYRKVESCSRKESTSCRSVRRPMKRTESKSVARRAAIQRTASKQRVSESKKTNDMFFSDAKFNTLINAMIKENYQGNNQFKVTRVSVKNGKFKVEYLVRESKKTTKGVMIGEGFNPKDSRMTLKFKDKGAFTESFTRTPSIMVECKFIANRLIPVKVNYDYKVKLGESTYRVTNNKAVIRESVRKSSVRPTRSISRRTESVRRTTRNLKKN